MAENWQLKAVLSANAAGMLKTLDAVNKATKATRKHLADVGSGSVKLAQSLALPVGLLGGLAAGFSLAGVVSAAKNFAVLGDEVAKGSQRIGVSIADYQRLNYVAGQSGVSAEELGSSMGRLNKGIAQAAAGKNKELASLFSKAGISMRDANGQLRSGADLLPEVADLFARNGNAATQARMGNAIYGKSWQALAPLLQGGSEGIKQLQERYKQLGLEVDSSAIKAGEAFGDQLDDLHQVTRSYGNTIMTKLLPAMAPLLESTIQLAVAYRDVITTRITEFITKFAEAMKKVDWAAVVEGIGSFFNGIKTLVDWLGGARNALIALAVFMNASAIYAVVSLGTSVVALGVSLGALLLPIAAVVAAGVLLYKNWSTLGPYVMALINPLIDSVSEFASALSGMFSEMFTTIGELASLLAPVVLPVLKAIAFVVGGALYLGFKAMIGVVKALLWVLTKVFNIIGAITSGIGAAIGFARDLGSKVFGGEAAAPASSSVGGALPSAGSTSLIAPPSKGRVDGQVNIKIDGLPPGSRVDQLGTGTMPINLDMGVRSFATGMPY